MSVFIDDLLACTKRSSIQSDVHQMYIDTINYPDDDHMAARNMYRIEINIHEKELCVKLVIYKENFIVCSKTLLHFF
jgi:hypothetical protein